MHFMSFMVSALAAFATVDAALPQSPAPDTSIGAVVAAAAAYVHAYQDQLTSVLAHETYRQEVTRGPGIPHGPTARTLTSDVFFAFTPADHYWLAVRDVAEVDGRLVEDHQDIRALLASTSVTNLAMSLKAANAKFNIGEIVRNFNEPTFSLRVFDDLYRPVIKFDRKSVKREANAVVVTLAFEEKQEPVLIHDPAGKPVLSHGTLVVEAGTGRVRSAALQANLGKLKLSLTTVYEMDAHLGVLVPAQFNEQYAFDDRNLGEQVTCDATYSDYRKFETKVIIR